MQVSLEPKLLLIEIMIIVLIITNIEVIKMEVKYMEILYITIRKHEERLPWCLSSDDCQGILGNQRCICCKWKR